MTEVRRDKLGRRIPEFDRSAANKKAAQTRKEKHGSTFNARIGALGGSARTNSKGFGAMDEDKRRKIATKGGNSGEKHFAKLKRENPEALHEISSKGGNQRTRGGGSQSAVSGG